jgi:hypothetical protein
VRVRGRRRALPSIASTSPPCRRRRADHWVRARARARARDRDRVSPRDRDRLRVRARGRVRVRARGRVRVRVRGRRTSMLVEKGGAHLVLG